MYNKTNTTTPTTYTTIRHINEWNIYAMEKQTIENNNTTYTTKHSGSSRKGKKYAESI